MGGLQYGGLVMMRIIRVAQLTTHIDSNITHCILFCSLQVVCFNLSKQGPNYA